MMNAADLIGHLPCFDPVVNAYTVPSQAATTIALPLTAAVEAIGTPS
jgi:hypothetical protein